MTITLTYDHATRLLRQIVSAKPRGYRNDDCRYYQDDPARSDHGQPIRLIGHLFQEIGIDHNSLLSAPRTPTRAYKGGFEHPRNGREIQTLLKELDLITCDTRTRKLLRITQHLQDTKKHTWRRVLGIALDRTRNPEGGETPVTGWNPQCRSCGETWDDQYDFPPEEPGRFGWDIASDGTALCGDCTMRDHTKTA